MIPASFAVPEPRRRALFAASWLCTLAVGAAEPPTPYGPVPSARQLRWHELELYGFLHFSMNTFTDKEWGYGDESPTMFDPTDFDADQIVDAAEAGGLKGLILTAKHHDGFCLWPSKLTAHSVKNSNWRAGQGDVVKEISEACRRRGLAFGVYLSPWDRNHADYGKPAYLDYYRGQLRELLTGYGPIAEVWFDGAAGGDGYYGGAREQRAIDRRSYYDWPRTWQIVRELQPDAMMFSDAGPDVRWVGNEKGVAGDPSWATLNRNDFAPGQADTKRLNSGDRPGTHWLPAECDVSIRPGWFYHPAEDAKVKTPLELLDLYYKSVGRGASFLLNLPPDRRGRIHENDARSLSGLRRLLDATFGVDLARGARATASNVRGGDPRFAPVNVADGRPNSYWATDDAATTPELTLELPRPVTFNVVSLREHLPLGQRVEGWALDAWTDVAWREFANGTSIGSRRLWRGSEQNTQRVRLRVTKSPVSPAISELALHREPPEARGAAIPRMPDGRPDLQGIWSNATITTLERPDELRGKEFLTAEEAAAYEERGLRNRNLDRRRPTARQDVNVEGNDFWMEWGRVVSTRRTSLIVDPPDGRIPYTPEGLKRKPVESQEASVGPFDNPEDRPLPERCLLWNAGPPVMPLPYNTNRQIVQTPDFIVIHNEMIHDARIIPLDGRPHLPRSVRQWMGDSIGRWQGDTLVVDTTNFTDKTRFRGSGEDLHVVERFTRLDEETIRYEFTVDDPLAFTRPWSGEMPWRKTQGPMFEYACHEGNYSLTNIFQGARAQEKAAREGR